VICLLPVLKVYMASCCLQRGRADVDTTYHAMTRGRVLLISTRDGSFVMLILTGCDYTGLRTESLRNIISVYVNTVVRQLAARFCFVAIDSGGNDCRPNRQYIDKF